MPERTVSRAGLFTTEAVAVPLSGVSIDAEISRFCARMGRHRGLVEATAGERHEFPPRLTLDERS